MILERGFSSLWGNDHVHFSWMDFYFSFIFVSVSPVFSYLCTIYMRNVVVGCLGGEIVLTWLAMILWHFSHLALVLYMCTSGTLHVFTSYGCSSCGLTYVSSGMRWGYVWVGFLFAHPGVIVIFAFLITL